MKFAKQLDEIANPKYRQYYIQYKELKKALKVFTGHERDQATVQEVTHWTSSFLRLGPNPEQPPEARLHEVLNRELERIGKFAAMDADAIKMQLVALEGNCKKEGADAEALQRQLDDLAEQIANLKAFTQLNFTGFRKILKKYDKWSSTKVMPWFMGKVMRAPLMNVDYEDLLILLNRIAVLLRGLMPANAQGPGPTPLVAMYAGTGASAEVVFFVDAKDSMQVKVQLAKLLTLDPSTFLAQPKVPGKSKPRTEVRFFDTEKLSVYNAFRLGMMMAESEGYASGAAPCESLHLRVSGSMTESEGACFVYESKSQTGRTEVMVTRAEVQRMMAGELPMRPSILVRTAGGMVPANAQVQKVALQALGSLLRDGGYRALAQASYLRSIFRDSEAGVAVVFDEDCRIGKVQDWGGPVSGSELFPYSILTVKFDSERAAKIAPKWLGTLYDTAKLFEVAGFSKAAYTVGHLHAKERGLPLPHWYRTIVSTKAGEEDNDISEAQAARNGTDEGGKQQLPSAPIDETNRTVRRSSVDARRLLHQFNTSPEMEEATIAQHPFDTLPEAEVTMPAKDENGSMATPLLELAGRPSVQQKEAVQQRSTGIRAWLFKKSAQSEAEVELPVRRAIVAVQPKTLYSLERTFLEWIHFATITAVGGVALMHTDSWGNIGRLLVLAAIIVVGWALYTFTWRAEALDRKECIDYQDPIGPTTLIVVLILGLSGMSTHALAVSSA